MEPVSVPVMVSMTNESDGVAISPNAVVQNMKGPPESVLDVSVAHAWLLFWIQLGSADPTMGLPGKFCSKY